jgi:hypothetical protein
MSSKTIYFPQNILSFKEFLIEATKDELKIRPQKDFANAIAEPMANMSEAEHKDKNAKNVIWLGHLPSWNKEYQMWEPNEHNIWGGQIKFKTNEKGKPLRDSIGKRIAIEVEPNKIKTVHTIWTRNHHPEESKNAYIGYKLEHEIPSNNKLSKIKVGYSQHFMARLHDVTEFGNQYIDKWEPRTHLHPKEWHDVITGIHRTITNYDLNPSENNMGFIMKSKKYGVNVPISGYTNPKTNTRHFTLLTNTPNIGVNDKKTIIQTESINLVNEFWID